MPDKRSEQKHPGIGTSTGSKADQRRNRLAAQLRQNLKKRKDLSRAKHRSPEGPEGNDNTPNEIDT